MDVADMPNIIRKRQRGPTTREWEAMRPKFTNLYLQENPRLTLATISKRLAVEDDFVAGIYSYNLRIKQWDICRNLKAFEKENIAIEEKTHAPGLDPPPRLVHHRPVRRDKISRHVRTCARSARLRGERAENSTQVDRTPNALISPQLHSTFTQKRLLPQRGLQFDNAQAIFHAVREWHDWHFDTYPHPGLAPLATTQPRTPTQSLIGDEEAVDPMCWTIPLMEGLRSFQRGYRLKAGNSFSEGCEQFRKCLSHQPVTLAIILVQFFYFESWRSCPEFADRILKYFITVSMIRLGLKHPLVRLLGFLSFVQARSIPGLRGTVRALIGDIFSRSPWGECETFFHTYGDLLTYGHGKYSNSEIDIYGDRLACGPIYGHGKYSTSEAVSSLDVLRARAESIYGRPHNVAVLVTYKFSEALIRDGDWERARSILQELMRLLDHTSMIDEMHLTRGLLTLRTLRLLAYSHWLPHEYRQCLFYERKCFELCVTGDFGETDTLISLDELESCLIETKDWAELADLRHQYPDLHQKLPDGLRLFSLPLEIPVMEDDSSLDEDSFRDGLDDGTPQSSPDF